ncbi:MAG: protein-L-isoaspartate(D-aspartate) O-methyltransferase [Acidobacteriota bacterium]|nr:protein-L-isoaspartate(D-aspartate) O-methyltransferase [Blastocatellia bacterium]MDW8412345.1 protein-L-isoaspartate(D-aspartate) O-methyltransferase [Acidobacteriota bacterium]
MSNNDIHYLARQRMVKNLRSRGIKDERVLKAMSVVPRHLFVEEALAYKAYGDHPLPIAGGQTISQPYIVARMTELLEVTKADKVLEIGTGSGYQTAILAHVAGMIFSIERIEELARLAKARIRQLSLDNVIIRCSDGSVGWPEYAPYQGILAAAAAPQVPQPLIDQLAVGGRLVMPVGTEKNQILVRVCKTEKSTKIEEHGSVIFVKMIGKQAYES